MAKLLDQFRDREHTLFLVDVSAFIFRAYFAVRGNFRSAKGEPTNAVFGVANMLGRFIEESHPQYVSVCYDSKEPSFRREVYTEYKANRSAAPDDLIPQFDRIEQLVKTMGFHSIRQSGIEADDLIATLATKWTAADPKHKVVVVTGDKDLMQLVNERVLVWDTMKDEFFGPAEVEAKFGVRPDQLCDYLAMVGDSSDNIPGIPSIGPKGAVDLLKEHGNLEGVIAAAQAGKVAGKKGETIRNNVDKAKLSQELATFRMVDHDLNVEKMVSPFGGTGSIRVGEACLELLKELNLNSLASRWGGTVPAEPAAKAGEVLNEAPKSTTSGFVPSLTLAAPSGSAPVPRPDTFRTICSEDALSTLLKDLENAPEFAFDLETTSLNPRDAVIVGIAIGYSDSFACYIPVGHRAAGCDDQLPEARVLAGLKPFLENPRYKKIGHNLKYDISVLRCAHGIIVDGIGADTMVADYVLDPEGRHNLETVSLKHLGYAVQSYEAVCGKGKDQIGFDLVSVADATRYSAEDAWIAWLLWKEMKGKLAAQGLMRIFAEVDMPLVAVLAEMECNGIRIDTDWLGKLREDFSRDLLKIDGEIQKFSQGPINLNSPKQLQQLLFEELKLPTQGKTKTGYSTDASVLEALAPLHVVPKMIVEYREIAKLLGTYVETLPSERDPKTGRIHAGFHQTVAATGRLSSSDPNLQNIPVRTERGLKIRRAFIPSEGNVLLSADYSQIELRLLAQMSGDPDLIESFQKGQDVHRRTAAQIYGVEADQVTDAQRGVAKAINFGLMYGKSTFGLAEELGISRTEAKEMIEKYFIRYAGVKKLLDEQIADAKAKGWTSTLMGRKRELRDINGKNPAMRAMAERMAMNTPIQGTAADLMKLAMIRLQERLHQGKFRSLLVCQVHDEVLLDVVPSELEEVKKIVIDSMKNAFSGVLELQVPLDVNVSTGSNWMDL